LLDALFELASVDMLGGIHAHGYSWQRIYKYFLKKKYYSFLSEKVFSIKPFTGVE